MKEMAKRRVDELGRVVLPGELRKELGVDENGEVSFCIKDGEIVLKKAQHSCLMCKKTDNLAIVDNMSICLDCIAKIKKMS